MSLRFVSCVLLGVLSLSDGCAVEFYAVNLSCFVSRISEHQGQWEL